jgi:type I restriction enzyme S subunit
LRIDNFSGGDVFHEGAELRRLTVDEAELRRYSLQVGDIVLNRVNGSLDVVGKACLIASLSEETVFESNMMRFVVDPKKAEHRYVLHFLGSPNCRDQIKSKAKVIQQASINQKDVASLVLPLPQVAEQMRIADRLDKVRGVVEGIRANTDDQESSTSMLRESILRKAFAGEL